MKSWSHCVREILEAIGMPYCWWRNYKVRDERRDAIKVLLDVPNP